MAEARKKPMPLVWIPATICVGLLIAAVYLGGRILTAHSHAPAAVQTEPAAPVLAKSQPKMQAPPEPESEAQPKAEAAPQPKAEAPALVSDQQMPMIAPQAGQRYIQVAALNLEAAQRYVGRLRQAKLEPHVAPGPRPELVRVLIGPFADQDSLTRAKSELDSARIDHFVRKY
jgi:cell division septation protein DedD